jgi:hypothetical protein
MAKRKNIYLVFRRLIIMLVIGILRKFVELDCCERE